MQELALRSCPICDKVRGIKAPSAVATLRARGDVMIKGIRVKGRPAVDHLFCCY